MKAARRALEASSRSNLAQILKESHKRDYPQCTETGPHFVPPSFGQVGFYTCSPPVDLTNHTRCLEPFNHEHVDHRAQFEIRKR
jgi:hypothetical protein